MELIGMTRRVDDLGRIVLPAELRERLDIRERDALEIYLWGEYILLRKPRQAKT